MSQAEQLITENLDIWTAAIQSKGSSGRGSSKKQELYGIKKLRELILELAVRGLLVPQDPSDEPASILLEKIGAEKERLAKEGQIRKQKKLSPMSADEVPFELPDSWVWCRLGEITTANTGFAFKSSEYVDSGTFVLRVTNINPDGTINLDDSKFISEQKAKDTYAKFELVENDLLLVMVGDLSPKFSTMTTMRFPVNLPEWRSHYEEAIHRRTNHQGHPRA